MTISYTGDVANASTFGCFSKILLRWRGSVYKLVFKELLAYITVYMIINVIYRYLLIPKSNCTILSPTEIPPSSGEFSTSANIFPHLSEFPPSSDVSPSDDSSCQSWKGHRETFENFRLYTNQMLKSIPLTFVLGFYVSLIVNRWWKQYQLLPWPDSFGMLLVGMYKVDNDSKGRMIRRTMIRYIILSYCIALRTVSFRLKKRFPTLEHLVHAGIMREDEFREFQKLDERVVANKWFLPLVWTAKLISQGIETGMVEPPNGSTVMAELGKIRKNLTTILSYDWISVPLVYTQVVTLVVYFYFIAALFGYQYIKPLSEKAHIQTYKSATQIELFYPFFLTLQFAFYIGWLKVAETLINPFGEDDDDFELNRLIDRHLQVGFLICDPISEKPDLLKDKFWNETIPQEMLYTVVSLSDRDTEFKGSAQIKLGAEDKIYADKDVQDGLRRRVDSSETIYESIRSRNYLAKKRRTSQLSSAKEPPQTNSKKAKMNTLNLDQLSDVASRKITSLTDALKAGRKTNVTNLTQLELRENYKIV